MRLSEVTTPAADHATVARCGHWNARQFVGANQRPHPLGPPRNQAHAGIVSRIRPGTSGLSHPQP